MNEDIVRVNDFDRLVGKIQTEKTMELGVGDSLLDVGCGIGLYTPMFLKRFKRVCGLDPSEEYIIQARTDISEVEYLIGWGETFSIDEKFDTINLNMVLEHCDNPISLLQNLKKHLAERGVIVIHVPNANSVTRRLGVLMGVIPSIDDISDKERDVYGHKRVYTKQTLFSECVKAKLDVIDMGGLLYKPLPNEVLQELCKKNGDEWTKKFMTALVEFGKRKIEDCADLYIVCQ
jgi:2-polyprenyl-3-methyl-5-hydroxy-6-metoxy-1,4-benzoquinol methylase